MNVEVVAAGVAANELGNDGDGGGEEDERGAGEAVFLCSAGEKSKRRSFGSVLLRRTSLRMTILRVGWMRTAGIWQP